MSNNEASLLSEINLLRALVEKRMNDLDGHHNPNLDKAMPVIVSAVQAIQTLVEIQARIERERHLDTYKQFKKAAPGLAVSIMEVLEQNLSEEDATLCCGAIADEIEMFADTIKLD